MGSAVSGSTITGCARQRTRGENAREPVSPARDHLGTADASQSPVREDRVVGRAADPLRHDMPNRVGDPDIPRQHFGGTGPLLAMVEASAGADLRHALVRDCMQALVHCPGEVCGRDGIGQTDVSVHGAGRGEDEDCPHQQHYPQQHVTHPDRPSKKRTSACSIDARAVASGRIALAVRRGFGACPQRADGGADRRRRASQPVPASRSARRALTSSSKSALGSGASGVKWRLPFVRSYPSSSASCAARNESVSG